MRCTSAVALLALLALCSVESGCRPRQARIGGAGAASSPPSELALVMRAELVAARAAGAGDPIWGAVSAGIPGDSVGALVELPRQGCALILGRGAAGVHDVDVFAFAEDGTVIAADESPAPAANVLACPPKPVRAFVSGRLAGGFGLFGVSVHPVAHDRIDAVARRFGVDPEGDAEPRPIHGSWPGLDERLAEHRHQLGGKWQSVRKLAVPLDPRVYTTVPAHVEPETCLDVLMVPSDDVAYVDLDVLEASGRWIGSGRARGTERALTLCSSEERELVLRSRPHAGRGLGAMVISRSVAGGAREMNLGAAYFDLRAERDLDALQRDHAQRLTNAGYAKPLRTRRGRLEQGRRASVGLPLMRGCSRIDVLTAAPISSLRAWLWNASGDLIAENGRGLGATLFACSPSGNARLDLETLASGGEYLLEVRHAGTLPSAARAHALAASRLLALLDARGVLPGLHRVPEIRRVEVSESRLASFTLSLRAGRCLQLSAALDDGASGIEVRLFEPAANREGATAFDDDDLAYGARAASARVCAIEPARDRVLRAELRANVGRSVALWTSQERQPAPAVRSPAGEGTNARRR